MKAKLESGDYIKGGGEENKEDEEIMVVFRRILRTSESIKQMDTL